MYGVISTKEYLKRTFWVICWIIMSDLQGTYRAPSRQGPQALYLQINSYIAGKMAAMTGRG